MYPGNPGFYTVGLALLSGNPCRTGTALSSSSTPHDDQYIWLVTQCVTQHAQTHRQDGRIFIALRQQRHILSQARLYGYTVARAGTQDIGSRKLKTLADTIPNRLHRHKNPALAHLARTTLQPALAAHRACSLTMNGRQHISCHTSVRRISTAFGQLPAALSDGLKKQPS